MSGENVDSFLSMFTRKPDPRQRLERRHDREKDASKSRAQLNRRKAERTAQINFRCSPAFKDRLKDIVDLEGSAMADVLERALELYAASEEHAKAVGDQS
ncbi:MAG: hypothetical protein AB7E81_24120 [Hyphomicrobiaceae bacterium]